MVRHGPLTGGEKVVIRLVAVSSIMDVVPQHSEMVFVFLRSVFLHAECHQCWLVLWYREHDTITFCLFKVGDPSVALGSIMKALY